MTTGRPLYGDLDLEEKKGLALDGELHQVLGDVHTQRQLRVLQSHCYGMLYGAQLRVFWRVLSHSMKTTLMIEEMFMSLQQIRNLRLKLMVLA